MILITGGAGYIGSHCVLKLLEYGYNVIVFDNLSTGHIETINTLKNIKSKGHFIDFIKGDLTNPQEINNVFKKYQIDTVFHFGALSQVKESVENPELYYYNNVFGSLNLFNSMIKNNVKKIIFSSTAAIYGNPEYIPIDEKHTKSPINPYGSTKLVIENILDDYDKYYGIKSIRLRYFNVAGCDNQSRIGEWHEPETHLIPNILKSSFKPSSPFKIYGSDYNTIDGTCIRDYINIDDLINAHILAFEYLKNNNETNVFNLGTSIGNSVKQIFDECEKITGKKIKYEITARRDGDPAILVADNTKANHILKWTPKNTITTSIQSAYNWEKQLEQLLS